MDRLKDIPSQFKSYEAYNNAKTLLQNYSKMNILIMELKSEALRERHWRTLMEELNVNWALTDLSLGQVWEVDLMRHEKTIREILIVAQGELPLENYMRQICECWTDFTVELVDYQQKTKLIKGWDGLFNKLNEHINNLNAMKLSPYYTQFEENAILWEDKLNRINSLFHILNNLQRRWVYLEGLSASSAEVSSEFLELMQKVDATPLIIEVIEIEDIEKILERLYNLLLTLKRNV